MHRIVNDIQLGLIGPEVALYGHWMEWRESNWSGRPLSMGDTLWLTGAGSAMSLRSSAPALLHALRTRYPGDTAPYPNQTRATYPGGVSELDAALHLLHPPDEDLEVGEITVFVEGADEAPARPRPTNPVCGGTHAYQDNSDVRLRWLPQAGRPPPPPVPLPLPRLPGMGGKDPRGARGAEAGGGGGAGRDSPGRPLLTQGC